MVIPYWESLYRANIRNQTVFYHGTHGKSWENDTKILNRRLVKKNRISTVLTA